MEVHKRHKNILNKAMNTNLRQVWLSSVYSIRNTFHLITVFHNVCLHNVYVTLGHLKFGIAGQKNFEPIQTTTKSRRLLFFGHFNDISQ